MFKTILLAEDDPGVQRMLCRVLVEENYQVIQTKNLEEALKRLSDAQIDLILLDLNMPGANGLEVMKIIRLCRPRVKVLVISGHITPEVRVEFQRLGQREFVQKPYRLDELGRHIRGLLDASRELASA